MNSKCFQSAIVSVPSGNTQSAIDKGAIMTVMWIFRHHCCFLEYTSFTLGFMKAFQYFVELKHKVGQNVTFGQSIGATLMFSEKNKIKSSSGYKNCVTFYLEPTRLAWTQLQTKKLILHTWQHSIWNDIRTGPLISREIPLADTLFDGETWNTKHRVNWLLSVFHMARTAVGSAECDICGTVWESDTICRFCQTVTKITVLSAAVIDVASAAMEGWRDVRSAHSVMMKSGGGKKSRLRSKQHHGQGRHAPRAVHLFHFAFFIDLWQ